MMVKKEDIQKDLKDAIRSGEKIRRDTLRMLLTAIKLVEVEEQASLDEDAIQDILKKEVKSRHDSVSDAERADRQDLIKKYHEEISVLETYLPPRMPEEEIKALAREVIDETDAAGPEDMGKVMKTILPRIEDRADGRVVSKVVRELLLRD